VSTRVPTIGLSMIVKNGGESLRHALESVRGVVDEMVVVDTGSNDNSVTIAQEFGAKAGFFAWENDFAKARNAALDLNTTDWILWLDSDEELDHEANLKQLVAAAGASIGGFIAPQRHYLPARHGSVNGNRAVENDGRCARAAQAPGFADDPVVRLFRRHPKIRFHGCVHEAVAPQIVAAGFKLARAKFPIHHLGFLKTDGYEKKAEFYLALLQKKVEQQPRNAQAWLELARQLFEPFRRNVEALACVARSLELAPAFPPASLLAANIHLEMGRETDALAALKLYDGTELAAEREHCRGDVLHNLGRLEEAKAAYGKSLALTGHDPQLESKLGYVEVKLGDRQSGFGRMRGALEELPLGAELHERLIKGYVSAGMLADAADAAERFSSVLVHPRTILRAVAIRVHLKQTQQARQLLQRGLQFFPDSVELKSASQELAGAI
jgi:tetratricopeptide (TPR) repeat protein